MHPAVQVAVVGIKTPAQIVEAAGAMGRTISREDYFKVRKTLTIEGAGRIRDATGKAK
jgi:predicted oxidoreductase